MPPPKKANPPSGSCFAFIGSDEARVKEAALALVRRLTPADAGDFANDIIEGNADNAEHAGRICANVIQALPCLCGAKVVWLKGANFLGDSVTGRANASVEGFENILAVLEAGLGADVKFVLSASAIDKRRNSWKRLSKLAQVEIHDKPDTSKAGWEQAVMAQVEKVAREQGLSFESGALELLVQMAGDDTRQLENELEKIDVFLGARRRVGLATVRRLVSPRRAGVRWCLGNALGARTLPLSLGQNAIGILLAAIVPRVRSLLLVKDLGSRHRLNTHNYTAFCKSLDSLPAAATAHLPKKKDGTGFNVYPMFLALDEAGRYTLDELRAAFSSCLDANLKLVTTQLDDQIVLERLLIGMLTTTKQGKTRAA